MAIIRHLKIWYYRRKLLALGKKFDEKSKEYPFVEPSKEYWNLVKKLRALGENI